ncbi:DUF2203 domain-containing protein [Paenibacillus sp. L3-i20]|uniref:DUF2203 domain-containing protein n=1 Tax=Paenibacillus sp. L3-i20 TaxID=2905833 RepID=UPI001EDF67E2|nr:DUF2203 domain-containing protein [Paenibacillus sp. L3-i20]GKU76652.1 hypothetical protein L3i20_v210490 [Paenibacillus sp. L3-i20]
MSNKRFTLEEANALLPQIKQELQQLQLMSNQLEEQYISYRKVKANYVAGSHDPLFELEGKLDFMQMEFSLYMNNITRKGVLLKMIHPALLDFPAIMDGEEVLLCWKEGEEQITHYHGWNDGYMGRKLHPDAQ